jgi:hypothetical protein
MLLFSNGLVFNGSGSQPFRAFALIDGASIPPIRPDLKVPDFATPKNAKRQLITHPLCSYITDGFDVPENLTRAAVRNISRAARLSCADGYRFRKQFTRARENRRLVSGARAQLLRSAHAADIVVFDSARVQSRSTYETPEVSPLGVVTVSKGGKVVKADNLN